jgi:RluA family pseudouridine synthase
MSPTIKLSAPATREFWEIPILFEDAHLLALDKPAGLLTSPDRDDPNRPNLMKLLHRDIERGAPWAVQRSLRYLANAHRLDFDTSGLLLLAKSKPDLIALADQFGSEKPLKQYVALVEGTPKQDDFEVNWKLAPHPMRPELFRVDEKIGKKARTRIEAVEKFSGYTVVRCHPAIGRTHQIRVHLLKSGLPIVGDTLYGGSPLLLSSLKPKYRLKPKEVEKPLIGRVALHAEQLTLLHPATHEPLTIECPWPNDLKVAVKYLRRFAAPWHLAAASEHAASASDD